MQAEGSGDSPGHLACTRVQLWERGAVPLFRKGAITKGLPITVAGLALPHGACLENATCSLGPAQAKGLQRDLLGLTQGQERE